MNKIFKPGINLINKLKYPQKFKMIFFLIIIVIAGFLVLVVNDLNKQIKITEKERMGVVYVIPMKILLNEMQQHRGAASGYLSGYDALGEKMALKQFTVDSAFGEIEKINQKHDDIFEISDELEVIKKDWDNLRQVSTELTPEESFNRHNEIISEIRGFIKKIGDRSGLILDSRLGSFYLAHLILIDIPLLTNEAGKVRALGVAAAAKQSLTSEERREILIYQTSTRLELKEINLNAKKIFSENQEIEKTLSIFLIDLNDDLEEFLNLTSEEIIEADEININPEEYFEVGIKANNSAFLFYESVVNELDNVLAKRLKLLKTEKLLIVIPVILVLLLFMYIFACFSFAVIGSIKYLESRALRIAHGNLDIELDFKTNDELKSLASSMNYMIFNLKTFINREKILRRINEEVRLFKNHEEIDNYLVRELIEIFNVNQVAFLFIDPNHLKWHRRKFKDEVIKNFKGECFVPLESGREIMPESDEIISFEDVEKEIQDKYLKNCLRVENIRSLMAYPISKKIPNRPQKEVVELTIISEPHPRAWNESEKKLFKDIMDILSVISTETIQRNEIEEIRKTFIATLTHDLKSPIIAEQKALEFLLSPRGKSPDVPYLEYLSDIYETNNEVLKLINNLLSVYHFESGKVELNKSFENIENVIKDSVKSLKYMAEDKAIKISIEMQENLPLVEVDRDEIKRLLMNLLSNAIKHNENGIKIVIKAVKMDNYIQVSVSDNGKGIPDEIKAAIFQRYITQKGRMGSGLGLYISKQIVEAHNGKIWFESEEEKGTTFYFSLPV